MANWSLTKAEALQAAQQIESSANKLKQYASTYNTARTNLLNSWEGSHKDSFSQETKNGFDVTAAALASTTLQLANSVKSVVQDKVNKDAQAAEILRG